MWHALRMGVPSANKAVADSVRGSHFRLAPGSVEFQPSP